ncbi:MAG TPA: class I SAM-dependent methyltransferase [bacterium]|jgi:ubiquinone/menaquinone biosynthesis C-methylase UbiE|nr:class I SAM-dependent methyltransferase [bacterium]HNT65114.1 class I SAM-dependent methyltransferase [bacterium]HOX86358.1 class I SAM-dependent methyltransferase [bacterium]HPG45813.1 class I SAM-dependent methyltransferase [bacterium]HPM97960.1 class I SAM-dependent methyltransferase [bacterium]
MSDTIGSYLWKGSDNRTLEEVRRYWTDNVNTTQFWKGDPRKIGSPEFFHVVGEFIRTNYEHRYRLIKSHAAKYPGGHLLEIGCGAGWESVAWAQAGMNVSAVDLSPAALELARKNFQLYGLEGDLREANAEDLPFESNSFDIVASFGVLHQTESTQRAISEVLRVLKPGGEAVITLYYRYSWKILLSKLSRINFEFSHEDAPITRLYTKKELKQLFADFNEVQVSLDYTKATQTPRRGLLSGIFNYVFVPLYNILPSFIRNQFGHAAIVVAVK